MSKKSIMKQAHKLAKTLVEKVGDYMIALKLALKKIWAMVKAGRKRMTQRALRNAYYEMIRRPYNGPKFFWIDGMGVPEWLMQKNLSQAEYDGARQAYDIHVRRETEKASLLRFETNFGYIDMWAPKSVIKGFE